jgi:hypothetical protein
MTQRAHFSLSQNHNHILLHLQHGKIRERRRKRSGHGTETGKGTVQPGTHKHKHTHTHARKPTRTATLKCTLVSYLQRYPLKPFFGAFKAGWGTYDSHGLSGYGQGIRRHCRRPPRLPQNVVVLERTPGYHRRATSRAREGRQKVSGQGQGGGGAIVESRHSQTSQLLYLVCETQLYDRAEHGEAVVAIDTLER